MAITQNAKKAHRASLRRRTFNLRRKDNISKNIKSFKKLAAEGKAKEAETLIRAVQKALDKAVKEKTIKKNTASRRKSRLSKLIKKA